MDAHEVNEWTHMLNQMFEDGELGAKELYLGVWLACSLYTETKIASLLWDLPERFHHYMHHTHE